MRLPSKPQARRGREHPHQRLSIDDVESSFKLSIQAIPGCYGVVRYIHHQLRFGETGILAGKSVPINDLARCCSSNVLCKPRKNKQRQPIYRYLPAPTFCESHKKARQVDRNSPPPQASSRNFTGKPQCAKLWSVVIATRLATLQMGAAPSAAESKLLDAATLRKRWKGIDASASRNAMIAAVLDVAPKTASEILASLPQDLFPSGRFTPASCRN